MEIKKIKTNFNKFRSEHRRGASFYKFPLIFCFITAGVLLSVNSVFAATEFISTIRATGGDYSLLSTWEAATQCDLTASTTVVYSGTGAGGISAGATLELFRGGEYQNITALKIATTSSQLLVRTFTGAYKVLQNGDQWRVASSTDNMWTVSSAGLGDSAIAVAECYNDWPTGLVDSITISGWTTSVNNYIKIYAPESERHNGIPGTGFYLKKSVGYAAILTVAQNYTKIENIEIWNTRTEYSGNCILLQSASTIDSCLLRADASSDNFAVRWLVNNSNAIVRNTIVIRGLIVGYNWDTGQILNCTVKEGSIYRSGTDGSGFLIKNTYADSFSVSKLQSGSINNASANTTAVGTNPIYNIPTTDFVDYTNNNLHITSLSRLRNVGADLSADFTTDIDGQTRPYGGIWDIGADETPFSAFKFNGGTFKIRGTIKFR